MKFIKWSKGKYNGRKIEGFYLTFCFRITMFHVIPKRIKFSNAIMWLWFRISLEAVYE